MGERPRGWERVLWRGLAGEQGGQEQEEGEGEEAKEGVQCLCHSRSGPFAMHSA
jgi:hypothetical protein